jgi:phage-related protein
MSNWTVKFYSTSRLDKPVEDFIENQDKATYAKIVRLLGTLSEYGPDLGMPYSRYMKNGLYELRVRGKNEIRIFYLFQIKKTIYLLHAFKKSSQKTPRRELKIAINRQKELT